jgi:hypothetical protein
LSLLLLMWFITFIDFRVLNHPCIPGMKPTWSWWIIFLMCCWIRFAIIKFVSCASTSRVVVITVLHHQSRLCKDSQKIKFIGFQNIDAVVLWVFILWSGNYFLKGCTHVIFENFRWVIRRFDGTNDKIFKTSVIILLVPICFSFIWYTFSWRKWEELSKWMATGWVVIVLLGVFMF